MKYLFIIGVKMKGNPKKNSLIDFLKLLFAIVWRKNIDQKKIFNNFLHEN